MEEAGEMLFVLGQGFSPRNGNIPLVKFEVILGLSGSKCLRHRHPSNSRDIVLIAIVFL